MQTPNPLTVNTCKGGVNLAPSLMFAAYRAMYCI